MPEFNILNENLFDTISSERVLSLGLRPSFVDLGLGPHTKTNK